MLVALTAFVVAPNMAASKGKSGLKSFHGKVSDLAAGNDGFTIKRSNGTSVDFAVDDTTVYKHIGGGFKALTVGEAVEVKAKKAGDPRVAKKVEAEGADGRAANGKAIGNGGGHGADDPAGDDHGSGGHGADDATGDDHGTGGSGADDGAGHNTGDDKGGAGKGADDTTGSNGGTGTGTGGTGGKHGADNGTGDDKGGHGHGSDG